MLNTSMSECKKEVLLSPCSTAPESDERSKLVNGSMVKQGGIQNQPHSQSHVSSSPVKDYIFLEDEISDPNKKPKYTDISNQRSKTEHSADNLGNDRSLVEDKINEDQAQEPKEEKKNTEAVAKNETKETQLERKEPDLDGDGAQTTRERKGKVCEDPTKPSRLSRRNRKRTSTESSQLSCPVCGLSMRCGEVATHLNLELDRLNRVNDRSSRKSATSSVPGKKVHPVPTNNQPDDAMETEDIILDRYGTFMQIKGSREKRAAARRNGIKESECPVCLQMISGTDEDLAEHVEKCLATRVKASDNDGDVDIIGDEDDEDYEEYTWAGQTRIRATTMLPGGLAGSGFKTILQTDTEDDLDVDGDDDETEFGQVQFSEADLIPSSAEYPDEEKSRKALRAAYLKSQGESHHCVPSDRKRWVHTKSKNSRKSSPSPSTSTESYEEIIESLKAKIKEQQQLLENQQLPKCLICMEPYHKPLTSVHCWHVHCEECWLRTLGVKKLCPQCNVITGPSDLRRIYL